MLPEMLSVTADKRRWGQRQGVSRLGLVVRRPARLVSGRDPGSTQSRFGCGPVNYDLRGQLVSGRDPGSSQSRFGCRPDNYDQRGRLGVKNPIIIYLSRFGSPCSSQIVVLWALPVS